MTFEELLAVPVDDLPAALAGLTEKERKAFAPTVREAWLRLGRAASGAVLDALTALLPALPGRRDTHAFVDLLATVATEHGRRVTLPAELAALAKGRSSPVLAACRRVPT